MTLDELSIRFTADISAFSAAMASLTGLIGAANAQVDGMAAHFQAAGASAGKVEKAAGLVGDQAAQALEIPDFARTLPLPVQPAATAASAPPSGESAPISISIPLEVDGYQLGVAAIEGINRVTNGSGRIELQF